MAFKQRLREWLLLSRDEINRLELEGVRNAHNLSEMAAAMTWAETNRRHPWRGFFLDILGSMAMMGAAMTQQQKRR